MPTFEAIDQARQEHRVSAEECPDDLFFTMSKLPEDDDFPTELYGFPSAQLAEYLLRKQAGAVVLSLFTETALKAAS